MDEWELLAAMQALLIYILIRLDEGETEYNNLDSLMIAAVSVRSPYLVQVSGNGLWAGTNIRPADRGHTAQWLCLGKQGAICDDS